LEVDPKLDTIGVVVEKTEKPEEEEVDLVLDDEEEEALFWK
jgi:hypothetical protein